MKYFRDFLSFLCGFYQCQFIGTDKWNRLADYQKSLFLCRLMSDCTKLH